MGEPASIFEAFAAVMGDVQAVGKDEKNESQNYSFRGVDAVVNAVGPALRKHGVVVVPTVESAEYRDVLVGQKQTPQRECTLRVTYTFYGPRGDSIAAVVCAEALDSGDKATAKAHSVAFRTVLLQAFVIPTHDMDPDAASPERASDAPPPPKPASQAQLAKIHATAKTRELDADVVRKVAFKKWPTCEGHLSKLTGGIGGEASALINLLTGVDATTGEKLSDEERDKRIDAAVAWAQDVVLPEDPA